MARITSPYFCRISHFDISYIFMQSGPKHSTAVFWHYTIPHYCKHIKKKLINCNIFPLHSPWYWRLKPKQTTLEKTFPNEIPWMNIFWGFFIKSSLQFVAMCPTDNTSMFRYSSGMHQTARSHYWTNDVIYASPVRLADVVQGLALLTLSWDKNWDSHSLVNGYRSFDPRIALVAPSPSQYHLFHHIATCNDVAFMHKVLPTFTMYSIKYWCTVDIARHWSHQLNWCNCLKRQGWLDFHDGKI